MGKNAFRQLVALGAGLLFGAGLAVSQVTNPQKVLDFFDFAGHWDPSLALTFGGALLVTFFAFRPARSGRASGKGPALGGTYALPTKSDIDGSLLGGAALFGVGWGLVGLCVGPAVAALAFGEPKIYIFVAAMLCGTVLTKFAQTKSINRLKT